MYKYTNKKYTPKIKIYIYNIQIKNILKNKDIYNIYSYIIYMLII